jgi:hypothetical protein
MKISRAALQTKIQNIGAKQKGETSPTLAWRSD